MVVQCFKSRTRFFILALITLCLAAVFSNILSYNMAQMCIDERNAQLNLSVSKFDDEIQPLSKSQRMWTQLVVAIGAICAHFIFIQFVVRAGARTAFTTAGILSGVTTLMIPEALRASFGLLLGLRAVQGVAFAANYIVIGSFVSKWSYYKQQGLFVSILAASSQLSPTLTNAASGVLCSTLGWRSIFYSHGVFTEVLFALFLIGYRNRPVKHPLVGMVEASKIEINKSSVTTKTIPYWSITRTLSIWAVWVSAVGNFFPNAMLYLFSVNYFHAVLGLQVEAMGLIGAMPTLLQLLLKIVAGIASDKIKSLNDTAKYRIFNSVAFFSSSLTAVALAAVTLSGNQNVVLCGILLAGMIGFLGVSTGGFFKAAPQISGIYAPFVTGNISLIFSLCLLVAPFLKNFLAVDDTPEQWTVVLVICGTVTAVSNIFFIVFINATPPKWSQMSSSIKPVEQPVAVIFGDPKSACDITK